MNCTRLKSRPSAAANDRAISVLPRPGRSSMRTWPPASTVVRISASAPRLPTTTRPISSRTASQLAVVVAAGDPRTFPSYPLQPLQYLVERFAARPWLAHRRVRETFSGSTHAHSSAPKSIWPVAWIRRAVLGPLLPRSHFELPGQHRAQVPVPVRPRGFRSADQRLGARQPAAQRQRGIVGTRLLGDRVRTRAPATSARRAAPGDSDART